MKTFTTTILLFFIAITCLINCNKKTIKESPRIEQAPTKTNISKSFSKSEIKKKRLTPGMIEKMNPDKTYSYTIYKNGNLAEDKVVVWDSTVVVWDSTDEVKFGVTYWVGRDQEEKFFEKFIAACKTKEAKEFIEKLKDQRAKSIRRYY